MTATDELRRLLDERGEYYKVSGNRTWWGRPIDARTGEPINVFHNQAQPMGEDRLFVELQLATPAQAVEATLGSDLKAENEKLRELVRELYDELDAATQYDAGGGRGVVYEFADRMRELGVEI